LASRLLGDVLDRRGHTGTAGTTAAARARPALRQHGHPGTTGPPARPARRLDRHRRLDRAPPLGRHRRHHRHRRLDRTAGHHRRAGTTVTAGTRAPPAPPARAARPSSTHQSVYTRSKHETRDAFFLSHAHEGDGRQGPLDTFTSTFGGGVWSAPLYMENGPGGKAPYFVAT